MIECGLENALELADIRQRYEYAYDAICDYLDKRFKENDYCGFKEGTCVVNRNGIGKNKTCGCCYSFHLDFLLNMRDKKLCKHLGDSGCTTQCISCKLYTCRYLAKKGISFSLYSFAGIGKIFNSKQIQVLRYNCFRPKEEIIDKLLEVKKSRMPYVLFMLLNHCKIKNP